MRGQGRDLGSMRARGLIGLFALVALLGLGSCGARTLTSAELCYAQCDLIDRCRAVPMSALPLPPGLPIGATCKPTCDASRSALDRRDAFYAQYCPLINDHADERAACLSLPCDEVAECLAKVNLHINERWPWYCAFPSSG